MHGFEHSFFAPSMGLGLFASLFAVGIVLVLAAFALKGYALWVAARNNQPYWFIALFVVNTFGILELVYLIGFSPKGSNRLNPIRPAAVIDPSKTDTEATNPPTQSA